MPGADRRMPNVTVFSQSACLVLLAHAVDVGPKPLFEPADLLEDLLAAMHLLLSVRCGRVGEFVDESPASVHKLAEGWCRPVGD